MNTSTQQIKEQVERIRNSIRINKNRKKENPIIFNDIVSIDDHKIDNNKINQVTSKRSNRLDLEIFDTIVEESLDQIIECIEKTENDMKIIIDYLDDIIKMNIEELYTDESNQENKMVESNQENKMVESNQENKMVESNQEDKMVESNQDDIQRLKKVLEDDTEFVESDRNNEYVKYLLETDEEIRDIVKESKDQSIKKFIETNEEIKNVLQNKTQENDAINTTSDAGSSKDSSMSSNYEESDFHTVNYSDNETDGVNQHSDNETDGVNQHSDNETDSINQHSGNETDGVNQHNDNTSKLDCTTEMIKNILESDEELRNIAYSDENLKKQIESEIYNKKKVNYIMMNCQCKINQCNKCNKFNNEIELHREKMINELIEDLINSTMEILRKKDEEEGTNYQEIFVEYLNDLLEYIMNEKEGVSLYDSGIEENTKNNDTNVDLLDRDKEKLSIYLTSLKWGMKNNNINNIQL